MLTIRQFRFSPVQENTYVIFNPEGVCAIVDPGCYFENERKELSEFIEKNHLTPKCLLNTHGHLDHVFGNKFIADTYGLQVHLHPLEKEMFDYAPVSAQKWGLPFDPYTGEFIYLEEDDVVTLGQDDFKVLFTPGHSAGSISYYCAAQKMLVSGDVLFREGVGRTDLLGGDFDILSATIREKLFTLPDDTVVYPGHGAETTIGHEKINNPFVGQAAR